MSRRLIATVATVGLLAPLVAMAQDQAPLRPPPPPPNPLTMTGCVSEKPDGSGRYTFERADGLSRYQLTGRRLAQFAGKRVELVGGSPTGGLAVRGGLVGPQAGARGVALDPAQESVLRQPGGGGAGTGPTYPEFKVARVKAVPGTCEEPPVK